MGKSDSLLVVWHEAELKHGRVAMLAAVGILVGEAVEFSTPLYGDKIVGPAIYQFQEADQLTGFAFGFGITALISTLEFYGINRGWETFDDKKLRDPTGITSSQLKPGYISGDLIHLVSHQRMQPLLKRSKQRFVISTASNIKPVNSFIQELNNGRLAMIGVAGMIVQELVNGKGILENLGLEQALPSAFDTAPF